MRRFRHSQFVFLTVLPTIWLATPAAAATVENLTYSLGDIRIIIPRIESTGGTTTDADLRAATDPAGTDSMAQRLSRLNATAITVPQLRVDLVKGAPQTLFTYRDIKLSKVADGVIDAVTIGGAGIDMKDPAGKAIRANYGAMSVNKVNLGMMLRIFTSRRTDPNEPLQTLYENFSGDGFTMSSDDVDMSMGRISGSGAKGRPLETPISDIFALAQQANGGTPSKEDQQKIMIMVGDVMQSMEFGQGEARDIKMSIKKGGAGEFGIGRIFIGNFAKAKLGEIAYEDIRFSMPDGKFSLGRFALRDLDFGRTFSAMAEAARSGSTDLQDRNPRDFVPTLGLLQISGIDADVPDTTGKGNSPDGKRILFTLGRFELALRDYIEGIPSGIYATVQNISMPLPRTTKDKELRQLIELGLTKIELSTALDIGWNEASQEIGIKEYSFTMPGMAAMKLTGAIGNVSKDLFSSNMAMVQAVALGAVAKSLEIRIANLGGVEKGLAMQAKQSGQTPQQVKQMLVAGAAIGIPAILGDNSASKIVAGAVSKFLADPKNLRISARAPAGLGVADVAGVSNPQDLLRKVDITAGANE